MSAVSCSTSATSSGGRSRSQDLRWLGGMPAISSYWSRAFSSKKKSSVWSRVRSPNASSRSSSVRKRQVSWRSAILRSDACDSARRGMSVSAPDHPRRGGAPALLLHLLDDDAVDAVDLQELHADHFALRGRHVLADEVGADRQLAMAAVDDDRELDGAWPAEVD